VKVVFHQYKTLRHPLPQPRRLSLFSSRSYACIFLQGKAKKNSVVMLLNSGLNIVGLTPNRASQRLQIWRPQSRVSEYALRAFVAWVRSQTSPRVSCDVHIGTGAAISPSTSAFPLSVPVHKIIHYSHIIHLPPQYILLPNNVEAFSHLVCYGAYFSTWLPTFWGSPSVPS
jgi:hypothetical protein